MIHFRIICALLMAWAINWALGQQEAIPLLEEIPDMQVIGLLCAAWVGAFSLAVRQGWGMIVAAANGVWAGVLTIVLSGIVFMTILGIKNVSVISSFDRWMQLFESDTEPVLEQALNFPLILITVAATGVVGLVTEAIHWALVRLRKSRGDYHEEHGTTTLRGNPRDLW